MVTFSNGKSIEYSYDATGTKVQELIKEPGKADKITDYLGGYIYENHDLQYLLTAEGRAVRDPATETFKEEYFVKDHLGNVRSTIDITDKPLLQYLATYEIASANLEGMLFDGVSEIREDKPNSSDPNDVKSGRLNGTDPERRTGTSLLMHVMADDQVDISVNNFYENYDKDQDAPVNAEDMLESLVSTLTGGTGGLGGSESHNPDMVQQLFEPDNYMNAYEGIVNASTDAGKPKAYLNYMLFDENMVLQTEFSKAVQVNGNGSWQTIGTNGAVTIPVNGYLAVYLSTRSQTVSCVPCSDVYFDQLSIKVQKGRLLEETHYYPHGLPMAALSSDAANNTKAQRHKYQGNEYIKDLGLNWMDFHARAYDPQLGRFLGVDPKADAGGQERLSPYAAMGNAPESMIDPNGEMSVQGMTKDDIYNDINEGTEIYLQSIMSESFSPGGGTGASGEAPTIMGASGAIEFGTIQEAENYLAATRGDDKPAQGEGNAAGNFDDDNNEVQQDGEDNSLSYQLPGDLDDVYNGSQPAGGMDCTYLALTWVENYLKSTKGEDGGPRSMTYFKGLNGNKEGADIGQIDKMMDDAGMVYSTSRNILFVGEALNAGYPVIAIERAENGMSHAVVVVSINIPDKTDIYRAKTKVYDPNTGRINTRGYDYWKGTSGYKILNPNLNKYIIKSP